MSAHPLGAALTSRCFGRPAFVVGTGRSGTSVLTRALGAHPRVLAARGESPLISRVGELVSVLESGPERERLYHERTLRLGRAETHRRLRRLCFEAALGPRLSPGVAVRDLAGGLIGRRFPVWRATRWCAKTFPTETSYRGLVGLYPEARFIYIVRNGLDVVRSRTSYAGFREDAFPTHCDVWARSVETYEYLARAPEALPVRHEELVADPEALMRGVLEFLGLPYDPRPVAVLRGTLVHPLHEATRTGVSVREVFETRRPPHEGWSSGQRETFRRVCGAGMRRLGYEVPF